MAIDRENLVSSAVSKTLLTGVKSAKHSLSYASPQFVLLGLFFFLRHAGAERSTIWLPAWRSQA